MIKNKKGIALNQAFAAVLTLVLVGVLVILGIVVFANLNTSFATTTAVSVVNETVSSVTHTGAYVSNSSFCQFGGMAVSAITNVSGTLVPSNNYTAGTTGQISFVDGAEFNNTDWNVSYTGTWGSPACTAGDNLITQFATYPALVGLVGTIIFLGIVIGVLVASFVVGRKGGV